MEPVEGSPLSAPVELLAFANFCAAPVRFPAVAEAADLLAIAPDRARAAIVAVAQPGLLDVAYTEALASLQCRSAALELELSAVPATDSLRTFDVVILGAGIHEQIFQNVLRAEGDPLRVVTLERGSVVSETTTFAGDRVNSNR